MSKPSALHAATGATPIVGAEQINLTKDGKTPNINVDAERKVIAEDIRALESDPKLLAGLTPAQKDLFEYYRYRIGKLHRYIPFSSTSSDAADQDLNPRLAVASTKTLATPWVCLRTSTGVFYGRP